MEIKIYTLSSSRNPNEIRYVGKTKQTLKRRLQGHICCAKKAKAEGKVTNHTYNWINHELELGNTIIIEELDSMEFEENESWDWLEIYWIEQMKIWGFSLTNIRPGGEDNHIPIPEKELIRRRAQKIIGVARDKMTKEAISRGLTGITRSEETKDKVRKSIIAKQGRPVHQFSLDGKFIKEWEACSVAADTLGIDRANLNSCCRGKKKTCGGFIWKYATDGAEDPRIVQLSLEGEFIKEFKNSAEVEKELGISSVLVNRVCKGVQEQTYNYVFKYYKDYKS